MSQTSAVVQHVRSCDVDRQVLALTHGSGILEPQGSCFCHHRTDSGSARIIHLFNEFVMPLISLYLHVNLTDMVMRMTESGFYANVTLYNTIEGKLRVQDHISISHSIDTLESLIILCQVSTRRCNALADTWMS